MKCQKPECNETIHEERLIAQPNTKTCGREVCKVAYKRLAWSRRAKNYRDRKKQKGGA